jgi:hypothetical protein
MPLLLTNPYFDVDAYLARGGKLTELVIPAKEKRELCGRLGDEVDQAAW